MGIVPWLLLSFVVAACVFAGWQSRRAAAERRETAQAMALLARRSVPLPATYDPRMVAGLPEPARRFFAFAIQPGTPLRTVAEIAMDGELSLGTKDDPGYVPMHARQVLAAPYGSVWEAQTGKGPMRVSGSDGMLDGRSWTRFRLLGVVPVAFAGGDADHLRSAFGRTVAEAAFWTPAFLLPREGVAWSEVDADTARATVTHGALVQTVDIQVDAQGQPVRVSLPRWTNANPGKVYRVQPFGCELSDFRMADGFRVPFRVDGGNFFGTPDYFPFYKARLREIRFR